MCIKISKFIIFIKWVLLYINAWGIYMGSENTVDDILRILKAEFEE